MSIKITSNSTVTIGSIVQQFERTAELPDNASPQQIMALQQVITCDVEIPIYNVHNEEKRTKGK